MEKKNVAYEIELKVKRNKRFEQPILDEAVKTYEFMKKVYGDEILIYESSYVIMLNNQLQVIGYGLLSKGDTQCTCVDVKAFCKYCVDTMCTSAIFVHNHPSGSLKPSEHDNNITRRIRSALEIFGIKLIDSIIVADAGYYSYVEYDNL